MSVNQACPVAAATTRSIRFDLTASTTQALQWRRSASSSDVLDPNGGFVASSGETSVVLSDIVLANSVTFEVVDSLGKVRLRFKLKHY